MVPKGKPRGNHPFVGGSPYFGPHAFNASLSREARSLPRCRWRTPDIREKTPSPQKKKQGQLLSFGLPFRTTPKKVPSKTHTFQLLFNSPKTCTNEGSLNHLIAVWSAGGLVGVAPKGHQTPCDELQVPPFKAHNHVETVLTADFWHPFISQFCGMQSGSFPDKSLTQHDNHLPADSSSCF